MWKHQARQRTDSLALLSNGGGAVAISPCANLRKIERKFHKWPVLFMAVLHLCFPPQLLGPQLPFPLFFQASYAWAPLRQTFCGLCRGWDCSVLLVLQTALTSTRLRHDYQIHQSDTSCRYFPHGTTIDQRGVWQRRASTRARQILSWRTCQDSTNGVLLFQGIVFPSGALMNEFVGKIPANPFFPGRCGVFTALPFWWTWDWVDNIPGAEFRGFSNLQRRMALEEKPGRGTVFWLCSDAMLCHVMPIYCWSILHFSGSHFARKTVWRYLAGLGKKLEAGTLGSTLSFLVFSETDCEICEADCLLVIYRYKMYFEDLLLGIVYNTFIHWCHASTFGDTSYQFLTSFVVKSSPCVQVSRQISEIFEIRRDPRGVSGSESFSPSSNFVPQEWLAWAQEVLPARRMSFLKALNDFKWLKWLKWTRETSVALEVMKLRQWVTPSLLSNLAHRQAEAMIVLNVRLLRCARKRSSSRARNRGNRAERCLLSC